MNSCTIDHIEMRIIVCSLRLRSFVFQKILRTPFCYIVYETHLNAFSLDSEIYSCCSSNIKYVPRSYS